MDYFLNVLVEKLPLCKTEWDEVLKEHEKRLAQHGRTVDSLRRKFALLHRKKIPTGDPLMSDDVRRAKHLLYKMSERADLGVDEEATAEEFFPDDTVPTIDSILSDPDVLDDGGSASTPSVTPRSITSGNGSDAASAEAAYSEERCLRPLVNRGALNSPKRDKTDDLMSLLKARIIEDRIRREEERQRWRQERKDREEERKDE